MSEINGEINPNGDKTGLDGLHFDGDQALLWGDLLPNRLKEGVNAIKNKLGLNRRRGSSGDNPKNNSLEKQSLPSLEDKLKVTFDNIEAKMGNIEVGSGLSGSRDDVDSGRLYGIAHSFFPNQKVTVIRASIRGVAPLESMLNESYEEYNGEDCPIRPVDSTNCRLMLATDSNTKRLVGLVLQMQNTWEHAPVGGTTWKESLLRMGSDGKLEVCNKLKHNTDGWSVDDRGTFDDQVPAAQTALQILSGFEKEMDNRYDYDIHNSGGYRLDSRVTNPDVVDPGYKVDKQGEVILTPRGEQHLFSSGLNEARKITAWFKKANRYVDMESVKD